MSNQRQQHIEQSKRFVTTVLTQVPHMIRYTRKSPILVVDRANPSKSRYQKGHPTGVMVAYVGQDGIPRVGWSRCNFSAGERWNKHVGIYKALRKALPIQFMTRPLVSDMEPHSMHDNITFFVERAKRWLGKNEQSAA